MLIDLTNHKHFTKTFGLRMVTETIKLVFVNEMIKSLSRVLRLIVFTWIFISDKMKWFLEVPLRPQNKISFWGLPLRSTFFPLDYAEVLCWFLILKCFSPLKKIPLRGLPDYGAKKRKRNEINSKSITRKHLHFVIFIINVIIKTDVWTAILRSSPV